MLPICAYYLFWSDGPHYLAIYESVFQYSRCVSLNIYLLENILHLFMNTYQYVLMVLRISWCSTLLLVLGIRFGCIHKSLPEVAQVGLNNLLIHKIQRFAIHILTLKLHSTLLYSVIFMSKTLSNLLTFVRHVLSVLVTFVKEYGYHQLAVVYVQGFISYTLLD